MRLRSLCLVPLAAAVACGGDAPVSRAPAAPAAERPYRPPADGRLTEHQVQAYVAATRALAARGGRAAPRDAIAPGAPPARLDGDEGVAFDGKPAGEEYLWVRQKVLEAEMRLDEKASARREAEIDRKTAESLRETASASTDPSTRDSLAHEIGDLERRAAEREKDARKAGDPSETADDALVARYRRPLAESRLAPPARR